MFKGQVLDANDLDVIYNGLKENNLHHYDYVLTGKDYFRGTIEGIFCLLAACENYVKFLQFTNLYLDFSRIHWIGFIPYESS